MVVASVSLTASPGRSAHILPVGGTITGACKTASFYKGLKQDGPIRVPLLPVVSESSAALGKDVGGQARHLDHGRNQKPAVVDDKLQGVFAGLFTPADELIPAAYSPGRGTEAQASEPAKALAPDQVTELGTAERTTAQIVEGVEQGIPYPGVFAGSTADGYQFYRAQIRKGTIYGKKRGKFRGRSSASTECILPAVGQLNQLAAVKLDQCLSATHLSELAIRAAPVHPFADALGELAPGDVGFRLYGFGDPCHERFSKFQMVYGYHAAYYTGG